MSEERKPETNTPCLFCELGKNPENVIYENELFYAQFDKFPITPGHAEVIPKRHIVSLLDLTPEEIISLHEAIIETTHLIDSIDLKEVYTKFLENPMNESSAWFCQKMLKHPGLERKPDAYNYGNNDGEAAGRTVHHLHIHIIPRFKGDMRDPKGGIRYIIPGMGSYK